MNSKENFKKCIACGTQKDKNLFRRYQCVCIECEKNGITIEKNCKKCNESKPTTEFRSCNTCIDCDNEHLRETNKDKNCFKSQDCVGCHETKTKDQFRRNQIICSICEDDPDVEYEQYCKGCNKVQSNKLFRKNRKKCIECEKAHGRNYRRTTTKAAEWVEENREKMSKLQHDNYEKNKPAIRQKESEKFQSDEHFRLIKSYRKTICTLISGISESNKRLEIKKRIQYITWMEFCFEGEMTIENHAECWQVDHVLALDIIKTKKIGDIEFEDDSDFSFLFGWFNTMPVTGPHNLKKNKYLDKEQLALHIETLNKFLRKYQMLLKINLSDKFYIYTNLAQTILDE